MTGPAREVEVVVDRLVLDGIDEADIDTVVHAFRSHLAMLAGGDPLPSDAGAQGRRRRTGGAAGYPPDDGAAAIGRRAAAEVWRTTAPGRSTTSIEGGR